MMESNVRRKSGKEPVLITRVFHARRAAVWAAWTQPQHVQKWWGPRGMDCPVCEIDFRVGGKFFFSMRTPDGFTLWHTGVYQEIVEHERIVYTNSFCDESGNIVPATHYGMGDDIDTEMLLTIDFADQDGGTLLTIRHVGIPAGELAVDAQRGWGESLDKLAEYLVQEGA